MNPCFPDWNIQAELPVSIQKKPLGLDHELVELLWENGQVVMHSQTHRKHRYGDPTNSRQVNKRDKSMTRGSGSPASPSNLIQDNETVSWIHCQLDDSFDKEFSSSCLSEIPLPNPVEADKPIQQLDENKLGKIDASEITHLQLYNVHANFSANPLLPPGFQTFRSALQHTNLGGISKNVNIPSPMKADLGSSNGQFGGKRASSITMGEAGEYFARTLGSSHCSSNRVANDADTSRALCSETGNKGLSAAVANSYAGKVNSQSARAEQDTLEPAIPSSSGGSGMSVERTRNQTTGMDSAKRKTRDADDSECQSEAALLDSVLRKKIAQKSGNSGKSRAAEVHNLSEKRRRDRINEKMRALQELLPHSNKSDKASMLDEAIEYLKSLQLQIQMMWMGSGMAPLMFPGVQHYMSLFGLGIGPPTLPSIHNPMNLARFPLVDQATPDAAPTATPAAVCQTTLLNPISYQNKLQNPNFSEQYTSYMGFHTSQIASQPMNSFSFGSNMSQLSQNVAPAGNSTGFFLG